MTDPNAHPGVRYDHTKALRSAMQALDDVPEHEARKPATPPAPVAPAAPPPRWRLKLKSLLRRTLKPPLQPVRAFFSASVLEALTHTDERIGRADERIGSLSREFVMQSAELAHLGSEVVESLQAVRTSQNHLSAELDVLRARTDVLVNRNAYALRDDLLARTPYGYVLAPLEDPAFVCQLVEGGEWEPGTNRVVAQRLQLGDVYVDVGAHVGTLLLNGARCVGPTGRAFAYEPTPRLYDLLCANVAINGIADICECSNVAVGRAKSLSKIHVPSIYGHASLYELPDAAGTQSFDVHVRPLDDLIPVDVRPTLVKIDVEGAELDVIAGMARILGSGTPPTLIVEYGLEHLDRIGVEPRDWFRAFTDLGYRPSVIDEPSGNCRPADEMPIEEIPSCNILFEPRSAEVTSSQT